MAKSLYSALFDWIVFRTNHALLNNRDLEDNAKVGLDTHTHTHAHAHAHSDTHLKCTNNIGADGFLFRLPLSLPPVGYVISVCVCVCVCVFFVLFF